ncbi:hypothetical protein LTS18_007790, partial [Coniosporium uncinatum]
MRASNLATAFLAMAVSLEFTAGQPQHPRGRHLRLHRSVSLREPPENRTSATGSDTTIVAHLPHATSAVKLAGQAPAITHGEGESISTFSVPFLFQKHQRLYGNGELKKRDEEVAHLVAGQEPHAYEEGVTRPTIEGFSADGSCGPANGFTCLGSSFGNCCSEYGWCGRTDLYCGDGCQSEFGTCEGVPVSSTTPTAPSSTKSTSSAPPMSSGAATSSDPIFSILPISPTSTLSLTEPTSSASSTFSTSNLQEESTTWLLNPSFSFSMLFSGDAWPAKPTYVNIEPKAAPSSCASPSIKYYSGKMATPQVKSSKLLGPSVNDPTEQYVAVPPFKGPVMKQDIMKAGANQELSTNYAISPITGIIDTAENVTAMQYKPHLSRDGGKSGWLNCQNIFVFADTG